MTSRPAVFLDRDGVVNRADIRGGVPHPPRRLIEFEMLAGAQEAVNRLRSAGFAIVIVTNQPDVARGDQQRKVVEAMNELLQEVLEPDVIKVCYHDDTHDCGCRKPAPGMLLTAAHELNLDLSMSFMVGDRWRDIAAGRRAGCRTVFIDRGYLERQPESPDAVVADVSEAAEWITSEADKDGAHLA